MKPLRVAISVAMLLALGALTASAQPVVSAKSGVIAYVEGKVFLGDQPVEYSVAKFPDMKENSVMRTEEGRAEVLLTPGVIMRVGENSSLKLITNRLVDTRLELLGGHAVVEADDIAKDTSVTVVLKNGSVTLAKAGIYRFESEPARVKVFKGLAELKIGSDTVPVGAGRTATLDGTSASVQKFNTEETDALDHWSRRRGEYLAVANVSAAKSLLDSGGYSSYAGMLGVGGMGLGMNGCVNSWAFNQWYGMYTYMPCRGMLYSPYGYQFWSPYTVMRAYYVPPVYYGGGRNGVGAFGGGGGRSYPTAAPTSAGYSGVMSSAGSYGGGGGGGGGFSGGSAGGGGGVSAGGGGVSSAGGAGGGGHGGASGGGGGGHH
jgi:hypothetical protein